MITQTTRYRVTRCPPDGTGKTRPVRCKADDDVIGGAVFASATVLDCKTIQENNFEITVGRKNLIVEYRRMPFLLLRKTVGNQLEHGSFR